MVMQVRNIFSNLWVVFAIFFFLPFGENKILVLMMLKWSIFFFRSSII